MPSTKVTWGAIAALAIHAAIAVAGNPAILNVVPVQWRGVISIVAGAVVAYYVKETRPAPSAVAAIKEQ